MRGERETTRNNKRCQTNFLLYIIGGEAFEEINIGDRIWTFSYFR